LAKDFNDLFYSMSLFLHYSDRLLAHQNLIFNGPVCGGQVIFEFCPTKNVASRSVHTGHGCL
jgi:hypothetical protein